MHGEESNNERSEYTRKENFADDLKKSRTFWQDEERYTRNDFDQSEDTE